MIYLLNEGDEEKNSIYAIFIKFLFSFIRLPFVFFCHERGRTNSEHVLCLYLLLESLKYKKNPLFDIKKDSGDFIPKVSEIPLKISFFFFINMTTI